MNNNNPDEMHFDEMVAGQRERLDSMLDELEGYSKSEYDSADYTLNGDSFNNDTEPPLDPMDNTLNIDSVNLENLKKIRELYNQEYGDESRQNENGGMSNSPKQLVKTMPGAPKILQENNDISEIVLSFIACLQLAATTAFIGAGWLLYLVNHLI